MKTINEFIENYRMATEGLNILARIVVALVLALIVVAAVYAFMGMIFNFLRY